MLRRIAERGLKRAQEQEDGEYCDIFQHILDELVRIEKKDVSISMKDVRKYVYSNATPIVGMTLTHIPTGLHVKGSGKLQHRLREELLAELTELVNNNDKKNKQA